MPSRATLRLHAVSLAVASWVVFAWSQAVAGPADRFGQLRGMDFIQFYAAGWFVRSGRAAELYDWEAFAAALPSLVPGVGDLLFLPIYPPQVALAFAPLAGLPYLTALGVWTATSVAFYAAAVWSVLRVLPALGPYRLEAWCFAAGFPPFLQLVAHGQVAAPAVLLVALALAAFLRDRAFLVGLALGSLAFKPQLGTLALVALLLWPSARLLAGLAAGAAAQVALVFAVLGPDVLFAYADVVGRLLRAPEAFEPKVWAMHGLRGAIELLVGQGRLATGLWAAGGLGVLWLARRAWSRHQAPEVRFAVLVLAALVLNPHLYVYDLTLMAVPLGCIAAWLLGKGPGADHRVAWMTYALVWLPLVGPLAAYTRLQLTPAIAIGVLWGIGHRGVNTTHWLSR